MDKELKQYLENKFDAVDREFDAVDRKFDAVDREFTTLKTELMNHTEAQTAELATMISKTVGNHEHQLISHTRILKRHDTDIRTLKDAIRVH